MHHIQLSHPPCPAPNSGVASEESHSCVSGFVQILVTQRCSCIALPGEDGPILQSIPALGRSVMLHHENEIRCWVRAGVASCKFVGLGMLFRCWGTGAFAFRSHALLYCLRGFTDCAPCCRQASSIIRVGTLCMRRPSTPTTTTTTTTNMLHTHSPKQREHTVTHLATARCLQ
ncbi:hypothetical protein EJ05DRAFT_360164 [Pseudovirgaria hyperparasitica]|uniref:Uncharacterized protein n=1 Tax=Pseudovirgaria hyperparasitica TaxID=470096 RepID=A0A6A6WAM2_9PEZI|nr:uncharacterized protein EJ05DRAFT_360164 [Pseudovirgaria hyperparasitica]KAF2758637.1 hypothetical protein EJ05DRAFT_360164 [Pseudovirgaria hyperparasitica]